MALASTADPLTLSPDDQVTMTFAEEKTRQSGRGFTRIRRYVYGYLLQSELPLGAYEILDMMKGVGAQKPPTVYRALDWLIEAGLVKKVTSVSKYVALRPQHNNQTVAFLLCQKCGQAKKFDPGPMIEKLGEIAEESGFTTSENVIEILGNCNGHSL